MTKTTVDSAAQGGQQPIIDAEAYREMAAKLLAELDETTNDMRMAVALAHGAVLQGMGDMPAARALVAKAANAAQDAVERLTGIAGKVQLLAQLAPHVGEVRS